MGYIRTSPGPPKEGRANEHQVSLHVIWLPPLSEGLGMASYFGGADARTVRPYMPAIAFGEA